jgi:hypothetical protein
MELAESQGGSDDNSGVTDVSTGNGARKQTHVDRVVGELERQLASFSKAAESMKSLTQTVSSLRNEVAELKRKSDSQARGTDDSLPKRPRTNSPALTGQDVLSSSASPPNPDPQQIQSSDDDDGSSDDEFELFSSNNNTDLPNERLFDEFEQFFEEQAETGDAVSDGLAKLVNKALRSQGKSDKEKLLALVEKYKRPSNIENLQVPKIDSFIWSNLKRDTRTSDVLNQRVIGTINMQIVPVLKAVDCLTKSKDVGTAVNYLMDAVKMACLTVKENNARRVEKIKSEIQPRFKSICENQASATQLFGDNIQEQIKKMEASRLNITQNQPQQPFLGKKGGANATNHSSSHHKQHRKPTTQGQKYTNNNTSYQQKKQGHRQKPRQHYQYHK